MKIAIMFLVFSGCVSQSFGEDPFIKIKISAKVLKNRKGIFIKNKNKFIGTKELDESNLVSGLPQFINELKLIVKNKKLKEFKKILDKSVKCSSNIAHQNIHIGIDECVKGIDMIKDSFWDNLMVTLEGGGCVIDKSLRMPSIFTCDRQNDLTFALSSKTFVSNPIRIYEKPSKKSTFKTLPKNYFFEKGFMNSGICKKEGAPENCYYDWDFFTSSFVGEGYVLGYKLFKHYEHQIVIKYKDDSFKITNIHPAYILE